MTILQYIFRAEVLMPLYEEYTKENKVSRTNTEPCRKYLEDIINQPVSSEDVLWCFYNIGNMEDCDE